MEVEKKDSLKRKEVIYCFDFDGTIADTLPLIIKKADFALRKSGMKEIDGDFLRKIRKEGIEEVFKEMNVPLYKLFFLYIKIKRGMNQGIGGVVMKEEMKEVLLELKRRNHSLGVLTSNSRKNVNYFLRENGVDFFDFVSSSGIFNKANKIKKLKRKGGIFVYIGDEIRDIDAGKKAGVKTVAVPWGLSSKKALQLACPDFLIENPRDLLSLPF